MKNTPPVANSQLDTTNLAYTPGGPNCIVSVQLFYKWPIYVSLLDDNLSHLSGNYRLLMATSVFRNEPYGPAALLKPCLLGRISRFARDRRDFRRRIRLHCAGDDWALLGYAEISDGVAADRKVSLVVDALANLSSQVTTISNRANDQYP